MFELVSPTECFQSRRQRFLDLHPSPAAFGSGLGRVRNYEANHFPFRAESHFLYFVGRHVEGALLGFAEGKATLYVTPPDPAEAVWRVQPDLDELARSLGVEVRPVSDYEAPDEVATVAPDDTDSAEWVEQVLGRIVDAGSASEPTEPDLALAEVMVRLRLHADSWAIAQIEAAAEVTALAHREGMRVTPNATNEAQVRAAMEAVIARQGLGTAYHSIVTTEGRVLHHEHSRNPLSPSALLLCDVGAESPEGWASDVTRTWPCSGRFDPLQRELYEAVLAAQAAAIAQVAPGVRYLDVHRTAARVLVERLVALGLFRGSVDSLLERDAAALFFPHGIGHLLGLDVHDMEDLGDRAGYPRGRARSTRAAERFLRLDRELEVGMVVTVEPGFYVIPSLLDDPERVAPLRDALELPLLARVREAVSGIRIEDDVLVTETGPRVLSAACPKAVADVEAALAS